MKIRPFHQNLFFKFLSYKNLAISPKIYLFYKNSAISPKFIFNNFLSYTKNSAVSPKFVMTNFGAQTINFSCNQFSGVIFSK